MSDVSYTYPWNAQLQRELRSAPALGGRRREVTNRYGVDLTPDTERALLPHERWQMRIEHFIASTRPKRERPIGDTGLSQADLDRIVARSTQRRAVATRIEQAKLQSRQARPAARPSLGEQNAQREATGRALGLRPPVTNDRRPSAGGIGRRTTPGEVNVRPEAEAGKDGPGGRSVRVARASRAGRPTGRRVAPGRRLGLVELAWGAARDRPERTRMLRVPSDPPVRSQPPRSGGSVPGGKIRSDFGSANGVPEGARQRRVPEVLARLIRIQAVPQRPSNARVSELPCVQPAKRVGLLRLLPRLSWRPWSLRHHGPTSVVTTTLGRRPGLHDDINKLLDRLHDPPKAFALTLQ